jgi:hypothetical protein
MLERRLKQLEDAFNTNTKVFSDGIQMLEAQNEVLRRALSDLWKNDRRLKLIEVNPGGFMKRIDWNAYLQEYIQELTEKEAAAEEKAGPGPILVDSDPEQPTIFGGG